MLRKIIAIIIFCMFMAAGINAHPGRLDEDGGHWDRANNQYHYHKDGKVVPGQPKSAGKKNAPDDHSKTGSTTKTDDGMKKSDPKKMEGKKGTTDTKKKKTTGKKKKSGKETKKSEAKKDKKAPAKKGTKSDKEKGVKKDAKVEKDSTKDTSREVTK